MFSTRRTFLKQAFFTAAPAVLGPRKLLARPRPAEGEMPALVYLTPDEYRTINRWTREIIPTELVLSGEVDVAKNIDTFIYENPSPDWVTMLRYLRLVRFAEKLEPMLKPFMPGIEDDLLSLKRVICFLGYYSDANGEADLAPEQRKIWPSIGYSGPKPDDFFPPDREIQLDPSTLPDRLG